MRVGASALRSRVHRRVARRSEVDGGCGTRGLRDVRTASEEQLHHRRLALLACEMERRHLRSRGRVSAHRDARLDQRASLVIVLSAQLGARLGACQAESALETAARSGYV